MIRRALTLGLAATACLLAACSEQASDTTDAAAAAPATPAAPDGAVMTQTGLVSGVPGLVPGVTAYKGLPFAAPPVGDLRWRIPQPAASWDGVRVADTFGNVCMQPPGQGRMNVSVDLPDSPAISEDCLYLNVWTPSDAAEGADLPVMVWIFGGAYTEGAGSSPHNNGDQLAAKGVVLVSFNYRLGALGFLAHPELTAESEHGSSGNYALADSIAALQWVEDNIAAFGGDPDNVTIFGESAGAAIIGGLVGSPVAGGLFDRAIAESGSWMGLTIAGMRSRESAEAQTVSAAEELGKPTLADLRAMPAEEAMGLPRQGMIVDGWIVPEDLSVTFAERRQNPVDVIVGSNRDEGSFAGGFGPPMTLAGWQEGAENRWRDLAALGNAAYPATTDEEAAHSNMSVMGDNMAWHMRLFGEAQAAIGKNAWLYYFTHEPPYADGVRPLGPVHTAEIPYAFNNLTAPRVYPDGSDPALASASATDIAFADQVSSYWVNFARTGDPNGPGLPQWPALTELGPTEAMVLDGDGSGRGPWITQEKIDLYAGMYARDIAAAQQ